MQLALTGAMDVLDVQIEIYDLTAGQLLQFSSEWELEFTAGHIYTLDEFRVAGGDDGEGGTVSREFGFSLTILEGSIPAPSALALLLNSGCTRRRRRQE